MNKSGAVMAGVMVFGIAAVGTVCLLTSDYGTAYAKRKSAIETKTQNVNPAEDPGNGDSSGGLLAKDEKGIEKAATKEATGEKPKTETTEKTKGPEIQFKFDKVQGLDFSNLNDDQKKQFVSIAADESCDCDCAQSLIWCLQRDKVCNRALALASFIIKGLEDGEEAETIQEVIDQDFRATYCGKAETFNIENHYIKGDPGAKITIVEFSDFECPFCSAAHAVLNKIIKKYDGKVRHVYKHFPLTAHKNAMIAARAAEAAGKQNKFFEMADLLFLNQDFLSEKVILEMAKSLSLDMEKFQKDLNDAAIIEKINADKKEGNEHNIKGTPNIYINGVPFLLLRTEEMISWRIEDILNPGQCCK